MGEVRAIARDLMVTTGKDKEVRQGKSLDRIRNMVRGNQSISVFIPLLRDSLTSPELSAASKETIVEILSEVMNSPVHRDQLWTFDELWMQLWEAFLAAPEALGRALTTSLSSIAIEDLVRVNETVEPEMIVKKCVEHRIPSVRSTSLLAFGSALVRAWPCAAASPAEKLHNSYIDAFLLIAQQLDGGEASIGVQKAAIGVIDNMLAAYLAIEPKFFMPVALLHPQWSFASVYAVPIIEMTRTLTAVLPKLCEKPSDAGQLLVPQSCPWLPEGEMNDSNQRPPPRTNEEWEPLASESAASRAALLWILVSAGGLSRRRKEEEVEDSSKASERCGSLIYDLVREDAGGASGSKSKPKPPKELLPEAVPEALRAALIYATQASSSTWRLRFAQVRAWFMFAIISLASNDREAHDHLLLSTEHILHGSDAATHADTPLPRFIAEGVSSIMGLWPLAHLARAGQSEVQRFLVSACKVIIFGAALLPKTALPNPPRLLRCLRSAAEALVQVLLWMEAGNAGGPQDVNAQLSRGGQPGPLVAALLCSACSARAAAEAGHPVWQAFALRLVAAAGYMLGAAAEAGVDAQAHEAQCCAAAWQIATLLSLLYKVSPAHGDSAAQALREAVQGMQRSSVLGMLAAVCEDAGKLGLWPEGQRASVASMLHSEGHGLDASAVPYVTSLVQALQQPSPHPRTGAHRLATPLCPAKAERPEVVSQPLLWLHSLGPLPSFDVGGPLDGAAVTMLSGPPVMIGMRVQCMRRAAGVSHISLRFDVFNVTPARLQKLKIEVALATKGLEEAKRGDFLDTWSFPRGQRRPVVFFAEEMQSKSSVVVWRDMIIRAMRPMSVVVNLEYDNVQVAASGPGDGGGTPGAGGGGNDPDAWSDDEEAETFRFACQPAQLPLSVFFQPFHGFDTPPGDVFPPPAVFILCPHSRLVRAEQDLAEWQPAGFHKVVAFGHDDGGAHAARACFAAVAMDKTSVVCFLVREERPGRDAVEVRSSSQLVMQELASTLHFWIDVL